MKFLKHLAVLAAFAIAMPMTTHTATAGTMIVQDSARKDLRQDRAKLRAEHRKLQKDKKEAKGDRQALGQAVKNGEVKNAREAAHDLAADRKQIARDKQGIKRAARQLKKDKR